MTSTPSWMACATAAAESELVAALDAAHLVDRDPGAGRDAVDRAAVDAEAPVADSSTLPAAVEAVCVPWPSLSRAVGYDLGAGRFAR